MPQPSGARAHGIQYLTKCCELGRARRLNVAGIATFFAKICADGRGLRPLSDAANRDGAADGLLPFAQGARQFGDPLVLVWPSAQQTLSLSLSRAQAQAQAHAARARAQAQARTHSI
eukprot:3329687-Pleurochrysis_carterae.AAC.6